MLTRERRVAAVMMMLWAALAAGPAAGHDWPQWRGPNRDGRSAETGLLESWPEGGPKLLWSVEGIGTGYSSVSVAKGRVYVTGLQQRTREVLTALGLDGRKLWATDYGGAWTRNWQGARTTATVREGRAYVVTSAGQVACVDAEKGTLIWAVDADRTFEGQSRQWGTAESPLVVDGKVTFTCGGRKATVVALDAETGKTVWASRSLGAARAFCSPLLVSAGGYRMIVGMTTDHVFCAEATDSTMLWSYPYKGTADGNGRADNNTNTPVWHDGQVYATSGYDHGGVMLRPAPDMRSVERLWHDRTLDPHHGGVVLTDGFLYGSTWDSNRDGKWACVEWDTGKVRYETRWETKGSVIYAEGMLYCFEEKSGTVALVKASPAGFDAVSSFRAPLGTGQAWAHPAISDGRLYIRRGDALMVFDIRRPQDE